MTPVTVRATLVGLLAGGLGLALLAASGGQTPPGRAGQTAPGATRAAADAREEAYRANNLGVAYLEQYNYEQAAKSFRHALEVDTGLTLARVNLAIALLYVPDLAGATREAQAALQGLQGAQAQPRGAGGAQPVGELQARYVLGLAARGENRVEDGIAAFQQVIAADPQDAGALINLGQLFLQQRRFDEASELFRRAIEREPFNATGTYNLAVTLMRAGKQDEGQRMTAQFQKLRESGYGITYSNTYLEQGRYAEALTSTGAEADLVDAGTPAVTFARTATLDSPGARAAARPPETSPARIPGAFTLVDIDRDGDLDLVDADYRFRTIRLFRNDEGRFTDVSVKAGFEPGVRPEGLSAVVAGDYDNDGRPDILVFGRGGLALFHQTATGTFEPAPAKGLPPTLPAAPAGPRQGDATAWQSAALVDVDHDGDLDIVLAGTRLLRNNGDGTFADTTAAAKLDAPGLGVAIVPTDFDNRRDIDLLVLYADRWPALFRNMRDGTFEDVAPEVGLAMTMIPTGTFSAVAAADVNKDGFTDFFIARGPEPATLYLSDGNARFRDAATPAPAGVIAAQFLDYDNDGLLDLVCLTRAGLSVWRNVGGSTAATSDAAGGPSWVDVSDAAFKDANAQLRDAGTPTALATGDLDGDGDTDLIVKSDSGKLTILTNQGGSKHTSLRVRLAGQVSNRAGIGAKIDMRAGSLRQKLELSSTTPAIAPADIVFGLGTRTKADVVRVLWPSGTVQAEPLQGDRVPVVTVTELDRKPSSCPFLYTWNGERFEFITDFMGGGEMGYLEAPGVRNVPDPEEFTRITSAQLQPRNGRYELRVTNELEETLFVDRLRLLAIAHPSDIEVYPREGLVSPPFPSFELIAARDVHTPTRVIDHAGRDVTDKARARDRRFIDDLPLERIRGYAKPHDLTIDLAPAPARAPAPAAVDREAGGEPAAARGPDAAPRAADASADVLLLTGWTDYAFSSDNIAASHAGLPLEPPSLAVQDASGAWHTVIKEIGIPVGGPQTIAIDLKDKWLSPRRLVRISTSMRVYWDQIQIATRARDFEKQLTASARPVAASLAAPARSAASRVAGAAAVGAATIIALDPLTADLRWRGFSAEATREEPFTYDYARVSTASPWKMMPGRYTREGDVRELLHAVDDLFVVSMPGDEIALSFDAHALPPVPAGWTRTFLLHSDGFSKEMDLHSASPDHAWPLPFHTMTRYPYAAPESYPFTPARRDVLDRYNTRIVSRTLRSIDAPQ